MGTKTDASKLIRDLGRVLPLLARDAMAAAMAAGTLPGPEGVAMAPQLRAVAAEETRDVESVAARIASLGGSPSLGLEALEAPRTRRASLKWLAKMQRESIDALVEAIPADADDAEGEATEHLLEHLISRKRDTVEILERAGR
ncbi:MAG: hypothetical protein H0U86_11485 [Chloroflexi bacterium]|nr:hypothetical protein [Chloroflexota bacterium]